MCAPLSELFRSCLPIREIYDDVTFNRFRHRKVAEGPAIGIDLGTTYSCVGYWKSGRVEIIANEQGSRTTPSYVAFTDNHRLIGDGAYNQAALNPTNTVFDAKRLIGRKFSDESVQSDRKLWPFKVVSGLNQKPMISVTYKGAKKEFAAEEISSMVLARMNQIAEAFIGSEVKGVVITVPAYFDQSQRQATMDAGKIAGINVLQILNEPTAAAIAYGLDHTSGKKNVLIFDLGGGTFDVAVLSIEVDKVEVKAIAGDTHLGGEDFDNRVVNHFIKEFKRKHSKDISKNPKAVRKLRTACERGKRLLSYSSEARIDIDGLFEGIDFSAILSRSKFDELNSDLFNKCIETVEQCLRDANTNKKDVDDVVLVGGSSRILKVQKLVRDFFDGKEICKSINPDEAVAYGAAVQAAILTGQASRRLENLVLVDVTPLSLGVKVVGDVMYVVIPRNTTIPARKTKRNMSTVLDNQTSIYFSVYEGERTKATANKLLGHFTLKGIKPAPRKSAKIDLYFDLQANSMLRVTARNVETGKEESITVTNGSLTQEEVETMIEDANKYKVDDDKHKMKGKARTSFENYILEMRENIRRQNVYYYEKKKAEIAIERAFEWLDSRVELAEVHEYEEQKEQLIKSLESC